MNCSNKTSRQVVFLTGRSEGCTGLKLQQLTDRKKELTVVIIEAFQLYNPLNPKT